MPSEPPITLAYAQEQLREWQRALERCASGQTYSIGNRNLTRQDVETIRAEIQRWHNTVLALEDVNAGRQRALGSRPSYDAPGGGGHGSMIVPFEIWSRW